MDETNSFTSTSTPTPDPTVLTTEQLLREIQSIRDWVRAIVEGADAVNVERFHAIDTHLQLVEQQRLEQKADTKTAVDAALSAQKEAVREQTIASGLSIAKSEAATTKQADQQGAAFTASIAGVNASITNLKDSQASTVDDLKQRIQRIESLRQGGIERTGAIYAGAGFISTVIVIITILVANGVLSR